MSIQSPNSFVAAYLNHTECELYRDDSQGVIVAYVPTRDERECTMTLGTDSYAEAEVVARAMGLSPTWN